MERLLLSIESTSDVCVLSVCRHCHNFYLSSLRPLLCHVPGFIADAVMPSIQPRMCTPLHVNHHSHVVSALLHAGVSFHNGRFPVPGHDNNGSMYIYRYMMGVFTAQRWRFPAVVPVFSLVPASLRAGWHERRPHRHGHRRQRSGLSGHPARHQLRHAR